MSEHSPTNNLSTSEENFVPRSNRPLAYRHTFTDEEVLRYRSEYRPDSTEFSRRAIAARHDTSLLTVKNMLTGRTYKHLPNAVPLQISPSLAALIKRQQLA